MTVLGAFLSSLNTRLLTDVDFDEIVGTVTTTAAALEDITGLTVDVTIPADLPTTAAIIAIMVVQCSATTSGSTGGWAVNIDSSDKQEMQRFFVGWWIGHRLADGHGADDGVGCGSDHHRQRQALSREWQRHSQYGCCPAHCPRSNGVGVAMPIKLTTPFEHHLGHGKGSRVYTHVKVIGHGARTCTVGQYEFWIEVEYGDQVDGSWVSGGGGVAKNMITIRNASPMHPDDGSAFDELMAFATTQFPTGGSIMQETAMRLYQWLMINVPEYAGEVE
jgi:hypothetical protein